MWRENPALLEERMRASVALLALALSAGVGLLPAAAQTSQDAPHLTSRSGAVPEAPAKSQPDPPPGITVPAGTKIPLTLKQGISSKNARPGDPVYAQTAFPIT